MKSEREREVIARQTTKRRRKREKGPKERFRIEKRGGKNVR